MFDITKPFNGKFITMIPFCISLLAINSKDYVFYNLSTLRLISSRYVQSFTLASSTQEMEGVRSSVQGASKNQGLYL